MLISEDNKFIIISSIGDNSNEAYKAWFSEKGDYDICLIYYGDNKSVEDDIKKHCKYFFKRKGSKCNNIKDIFESNEILHTYKYFWIPDDDIVLDVKQISRMFHLCSKYEIDVASPSHNKNGKISWSHMTTHFTSLFRKTNFVEITAPILSNYAITKLFRYLYTKDVLCEYGLDYVIQYLLFHEKPFYIFDEISVINPHDNCKIGPLREIDKLMSDAKRVYIWEEFKKKYDLNILRPIVVD